jgi:hypothetical protein
MKYAVVEQIEKIGLRKFAKFLYEEKAREILRISSMQTGKAEAVKISDIYTKPELRRISYFKRFIKNTNENFAVKNFLSNCNIQDVGFIENFTKQMSVVDFESSFNSFVEILERFSGRFTEPQMKSFAMKLWKQLLTIRDSEEKNDVYYHTYGRINAARDTYRMMNKLYAGNTECYRNACQFTSITASEKIREKHDAISCLCKYRQYPQERYDDVSKKYRKNEFEDDDFILRLPADTGEIIKEGARMNHCVGSYVDDVMDGKSVIMFLRRKSNPQKEYATLELGKNSELLQVKCKCNQILTSESALSFLSKWVIDKKIKPSTRDVLWDTKNKKFSVCNVGYRNYYIEADSVV